MSFYTYRAALKQPSYPSNMGHCSRRLGLGWNGKILFLTVKYREVFPLESLSMIMLLGKGGFRMCSCSLGLTSPESRMAP